MRLQKDIANHFYEIVVIIIGEEILGLSGPQLGDKSKEGHFCLFMQQLFRSFEKLEKCLNFRCRRILTNLCLYSFKHLVHPINLRVIVMFIFCYEYNTSLTMNFSHLIVWMKLGRVAATEGYESNAGRSSKPAQRRQELAACCGIVVPPTLSS
jgi:hypothetical protein